MSRMDYLALEEVAWLLAETFIYLVGAPHPPRLSILNGITVQPYGTWFVRGAILAPPNLTVQTVRRCLHEHVCSPFFKWTVGLFWTREQNWGRSSYVYSQDATTVSLLPCSSSFMDGPSHSLNESTVTHSAKWDVVCMFLTYINMQPLAMGEHSLGGSTTSIWPLNLRHLGGCTCTYVYRRREKCHRGLLGWRYHTVKQNFVTTRAISRHSTT